MKKPVFKYSKLSYALSAILTIPLLIDFCTACHLFPLWLAWTLLTFIAIISCFRLWFAFSQHCYKFAAGLIGQLLIGAGVLTFFQLSYTNVIETPVSHPETPAIINIASPIPALDSVGSPNKSDHHVEKNKNTKESKDIKKNKSEKTPLHKK